jgi:8-oxo-dGTP pyrophosphatase MutT (NUDIX family)
VVLMRQVRAAGGVIWRRGEDGVEVLLIHRPRYRDWSLPKGKVKSGESDEDAAIREIDEEIGVSIQLLGRELPSTRYRDVRGRDKVVRYWAVELPADAEPFAGDGVSEIRWVPLADAPEQLSWERDEAVLDGLEDAIR